MIYYVLCPPYHGATLLSLLLNNHSQVLALGDTNPTREYDQTCSCGQKVSVCPFWSKIREETYYDPAEKLPGLLPAFPQVCSVPALNKIANTSLALAAHQFGPQAWNLARGPAARFRARYEAFLAACRDLAPHTRFVDGEKSLLKFMASASMGLPAKGVIHLLRDPRGYAASVRKYAPGTSPEAAATQWASQHRRIRHFTRVFDRIPVFTLRHEDLIRAPQEAMNRLFGFMGLEPENVVHAPRNPAKHHLMGNKMLRGFDGTVEANESWKESLSLEESRQVAAVAGSFFGISGYKP